MKNIAEFITEKLYIRKYSYTPKTLKELDSIIKQRIKEDGNNCDLNDIDVSHITSMSGLFHLNNTFDGNISRWNVSNVTDMRQMFLESSFTGNNGGLSDWNVSNVIDMEQMFDASNIECDLSKWKVNSKCNTDYMFDNTELEVNPPKWYKNK